MYIIFNSNENYKWFRNVMYYIFGKNQNILFKVIKENLRERFIMFVDRRIYSVKMLGLKNINLWGKYRIRSLRIG